MTMKREDFDDVSKIIATIREKHNGGKYDDFIELLCNDHMELFATFLMQEMHKAEINILIARKIKKIAEPLLGVVSAEDVLTYVLDLRDEVRTRVALPTINGKYLTVEEFFDGTNER